MPRFSKTVETAFEEVFINYNFETVFSQYQNSENDLDKAYMALWICYFHLANKLHGQVLHYLDDKEFSSEVCNNDDFLQYIRNCFYCLYWTGFYYHPRDIEKSEQYYNDAKKILEKILFSDDWEKIFSQFLITFLEGFREWQIKRDFKNAVNKYSTSIRIISSLPTYGERLSKLFQFDLGFNYMLLGEFVTARKLLQSAYEACPENNFRLKIRILTELANVELNTGKVRESTKQIQKSLIEAEKLGNAFLINKTHRNLGVTYELVGDYENARTAYEDSKEGMVKHWLSNPDIQIPYIFQFNIHQYKLTHDEKYLQKASEVVEYLEINASDELKQNTIYELAIKYSKALLFMRGNIRKRVLALDYFEEVHSIYKLSFYIQKEYLDLLMDEYEISQDTEFLKKIEEILEIFDIDPQKNNPEAVMEYYDYKRIFARLEILVNGNFNSGMKMLMDVKEELLDTELIHLINLTNVDITYFEEKYSKWTEITENTKNFLLNSKLEQYLTLAKKMNLRSQT
ncbi:MAG: hypothetical protein ACW981_11875 [Candidatus Hodarchaeales archaeon]|jgi:hypothetical protein